MLSASPVLAGDCQSEIANLDAQIESQADQASGAVKEAAYMRDEAEKACSAGNEQEAQELVAMARLALGLSN